MPIVVIAFVVMLVGAAIASAVTPPKRFAVSVADIQPGATSIPVTISNATSGGNANINSLIITAKAPLPDDFTITSASPGAFAITTLSNGDIQVKISGITSIRPGRSQIFTLQVSGTNIGCDGATIEWGAQAFVGNSFNGDTFALQTGMSDLSSQIGACSATVTVTKFKDPNLDGEQTGSEGTLEGWEFTLTGGDAPVVQSTGANGTTSFSVDANQAYEVCETDDRLGGTAGWLNTTPGGDACITVPATDTEPGETSQLVFGNAEGILGCTSEDNQIDVTGPNAPDVALSGIRLVNADGSPCIKIPYVFEENPEGGFIFTKDLEDQPFAQFLITQNVVRDITNEIASGLQFTPNTANGYTTEIAPTINGTYVPVPLCQSVQRNAQLVVTGAVLPTGAANPDNVSWCIADQQLLYGYDGAADAASPGEVTIRSVLYGLGDPVIRTRPST
ncbi:MAG TPA: hypothetical protein VE032_08590 [Actinomycetota bacterium]|nr:hypothetical protein [Actinomycetota bacterium]